MCRYRAVTVALTVLALAGAVATPIRTKAGDLPDGYWRLPLPSQGSPPEQWSKIERSLRPADCGSCHVERYDEWRLSRHAHAFSPGFVGQVLAIGDAEQIDACMNCHAPLAEQKRQFTAQLRGDNTDDP